ncbi:hypothetical protein BJ944DRAFT_271740 [Cunninghamella echinulata]|nr:hypothetical protein BJ944DRAFT_271740 [Cunninghamella echinulata]
MTSEPTIYCCLPRPGITTICFIYGCIGFSSIFTYLFINFLNYKFLGDEYKWPGIYEIDHMKIILYLVFGTNYFYASYLSYKKKIIYIKPLVKIFISNIALNIAVAFYDLYGIFQCIRKMNNPSDEAMSSETNEPTSPQAVFYFAFFYVLSWILFYILPLVNEVYFILKVNRYIEYIEAKKNDVKLIH